MHGVFYGTVNLSAASLCLLYTFIVDIYTEEQPPFILLIQTEPSTVWIQIPAKQPGLIKMQKIRVAITGVVPWSVRTGCILQVTMGTLVGHDLTTDKVYETVKLSPYPIRAGLTCDKENSELYTVSNHGTLYKIQISDTGIRQVKFCQLPFESYINCTSTPTLYNGRLYTGCLADGYGALDVVNSDTMTWIYRAKGEKSAEIKSSPLLTTAYASAENNEKVILYFSYNAPPGGISYLEDSKGQTFGVIKPLFIPDRAKQFCLSSVTASKEGVLYYSNDSGTLFAVGAPQKAIVSPTPTLDTASKTPSPAGTTSPAPNNSQTVKAGQSAKNNRNTQSAVKIKKPWKIKVSRKKKKVTLQFSRSKQTKTFIYVKKGKVKMEKNGFHCQMPL